MPRPTLRTAFPFLVAGLTALAGVLPAKEAAAVSPYLVIPEPEVAEATSAYRYANMTAAEALAELDKRKVPYTKADPMPGVVAPVRLTGKLHGVHIHSSIPESQRATSPYEVLDARLALALDDFAKILSRHDIEEVVHYSLYRPNVPRHDHDVKEAKTAVAKKSTAPAPGGASGAKGGTLEAKGGTLEAKGGTSVAKGGTLTARGGTPVAKGGAPTAKGGTPVAKGGAPAAKGGTPVAKGGAPAAKAGTPGVKSPSALPPLPAGKPFRSPPSKGEGKLTHSIKQKTPVAVDKTPAAAPAPAASPAKPGPAAAAKRPAASGVSSRTPASPSRTASASRGVSPRAAVPARKAAGAVPVRARASAPVKVEAKAAAAVAVPVKTRQTWAAPGTRHPAGLAIDVAMLKKRDGQWVSVATHFRGRIGDKTCGDGVRTADTPEARELRSIVCEANDQGVFTYVLTPNYNAAHYDHFHMEIRPQVKWFLYQ